MEILKSCDLSTEYVDKLPKRKKEPEYNNNRIKYSKTTVDDTIFDPFIMRQEINKAKETLRLTIWLNEHSKNAIKKAESHKPLKEEVDRLKKEITKQLNLLDIRWECGWNDLHFRGCLLSFLSLIEQHREIINILRGRILVFAPFTGISLDGYVMLNSGEVRHNWLDVC